MACRPVSSYGLTEKSLKAACAGKRPTPPWWLFPCAYGNEKSIGRLESPARGPSWGYGKDSGAEGVYP